MFIYGCYETINVSGKFILDFSYFSIVILGNICQSTPFLFLLELSMPILPSSSNKSNNDVVASNCSFVRL